MKVRANVVKAILVIAGILGYGVLLLPWYEVTSSVEISGFGSTFGSFGEYLGFVAAGTSVFGYVLYVLPGAAIALGVGTGNFSKQLNTRAKAMLLELIGIVEVICLILVNSQMGGFGTDISGMGYSASSGFEPLAGYSTALGVYIATGIAGLVLMFVAPKPQEEEAEKAETAQ